jgi:ABC-type transporter Mla subunit MlaD
MARIPGIDGVIGSLLGVLQAQTEALQALPSTVASLTTAVKSLGEIASSTKDTVAALQRLTLRIDAMAVELEPALLALGPGLQRLAAVLDDPVIDEIPDTLKQVQADILPVLRTLAETHEKVAFIAGSTERIMTFVDDTSRTIAGLPGAALLGRRRVVPAPKPGTPTD